LNKEYAERLVRLAESPDGQALLHDVGKDFDAAMKKLLYGDDNTLPTDRGYARALHEVLKKFTDAHAEMLAQQQKGNT
jgi:hypothetical protein